MHPLVKIKFQIKLKNTVCGINLFNLIFKHFKEFRETSTNRVQTVGASVV